MQFNSETGFATRVMRGLFGLAVASLALSSTTVAALGLEDLRMAAFALVFAALPLGAGLVWPYFPLRDALAPLLAFWLLALIALLSALVAPLGVGRLVDYKLLLPIMALLMAGSLRAAMGGMNLSRFALAAGALYVLATAGLALALPSLIALRNVASHVRIDITGSVVLHASLCTIVALTAAAAIASGRRPFGRLVAALVLAMATWMVILTGTRSPLFVLGFFVLLWAVAGRPADLARPRAIGLGLIAVLAFIVLTFWASDTLWARLSEVGRADYSSGRWPSIHHWLTLAAAEPFGLGMGAVRRMLSDGRPEIMGGHLLEWPHNEFIRYYVEAGALGFGLVLLLVVEALRRALRRARATNDPVERTLLLAIAADMLAQCLLQNYFNGIYHATVMLLVLGMLAATPIPAARPTDRRAATTPAPLAAAA